MIIITEFMDEAAVQSLQDRFDVRYDPGLADRQSDIATDAKGTRALIVRNRTRVTADLLDQLPDLVCVGRLGVGLDNIDTDACSERGVAVYPATGANSASVAEYVITAALMLVRRSWFMTPQMIAGEWPRQAAGAGSELAGKTLGLIGFGLIARDLAGLAAGLGMDVIAHDPFVANDDPAWRDVEQTDIDALLARADVISLHVPLTDATFHLIDQSALSRMKPGAILVNAARGGVVNEAALAHALRSGQLGGAALDTFETEPLTTEAAAIFDGARNLILTPHIAGVSVEANRRVSKMIADKVLAHLLEGS
ncbi:MAG: hydroxyacid dehydrogenase [Alphaproteobacteria bacterium]|nr:hydroxyacid dehydrogenase [Alphaproteobacteria bacterium]